MAEHVDAPLPRIDAGDADLQTQVDELRQALRDWRRTREYSQPTQERLEQITLQCARMVEAWQHLERRGALEKPGDRAGVDNGLLLTTGERIRALERSIEREWDPLAGGDDPGKQLNEQATSLAESCVAAANLALRGFANAEARITVLERDLQSSIAQLSRDLQAVVTELRGARPQSLPGAASAFPLESVMRIHQEMREDAVESTPPALPAKPEELPRALPQEAAATTALAARVDTLERTVEHAVESVAQPRSGWRPAFLVAGIIVLLAGVALLGLWMQRRVDERLNLASQQVAEAERERDATTAATREEAAREVADARRSAEEAQVVGHVLAAPDLVRFRMVPADANSRAFGQVLFSRSRGLVFSASRLEPAGAGRTYQLWLVTRTGVTNAGVITPDSAGRVTLVNDSPLNVIGRLTGAWVTLEPEGGANEPGVNRVLVRVETPAS